MSDAMLDDEDAIHPDKTEDDLKRSTVLWCTLIGAALAFVGVALFFWLVPFGPQIVAAAFFASCLVALMMGGEDRLIVVGGVSLLAMGVFVLWAGGFWEPFGLPSAF